MAVFRLNTYLRTRGFKNITPNFGMGKTNASWTLTSKKLKVTRQLSLGQVIITLYHNNNIVGRYTNEQKEDFKTQLQQFIA